MSKKVEALMFAEYEQDRCYSRRLELANRHVERGEWACGHAITQGLRQCAARDGCVYQEDCSTAACNMMREIRSILGH